MFSRTSLHTATLVYTLYLQDAAVTTRFNIRVHAKGTSLEQAYLFSCDSNSLLRTQLNTGPLAVKGCVDGSACFYSLALTGCLPSYLGTPVRLSIINATASIPFKYVRKNVVDKLMLDSCLIISFHKTLSVSQSSRRSSQETLVQSMTRSVARSAECLTAKLGVAECLTARLGVTECLTAKLGVTQSSCRLITKYTQERVN